MKSIVLYMREGKVLIDFFITHFRYFIFFCFILSIAFLFLLLRYADSRKGTLFPFIKRKKKHTYTSMAVH